jgi:hypothetical protein
MSPVTALLTPLLYLLMAQAPEPGVLSVPVRADAEEAAAAAPSRPVLVELYMSQGCGLCPDANRFLGQLDRERDDVIVLAFGVDYWDMYGWADIYARPEYVARQRAYLPRLGQSRLFTPHFIIDGVDDAASWNRDQVSDAVDSRVTDLSSSAENDIEIAISDGPFGSRRITLDGETAEELDVWLVAYQPNWKSHVIEGGENAGEEMLHYNMVKRLTYLGEWEGGEAEFMGEAFDRFGAVVIVQGERGGPIRAIAHEPAAYDPDDEDRY